MQGGGQLPPSGAPNDSLSTLAFLGQQLRQFSNSTPPQQQRHQSQPLLLGSSSLGNFSRSVNEQKQAQAHAHLNLQHHQNSQSMLRGGGGGGGVQAHGGSRSGDSRAGGMILFDQHLQLDDQQQFGAHIMNSNFAESIASQSMVEQNVQGIMDHLAMLQERVQQLQALVPLISQTARCESANSNVVAQQQAASAAVVSIISQLAVAAFGLLPQPAGQQAPELNPLNHHLRAARAVSPTSSFFQQSPLENSLGNIFATSGGANANATANATANAGVSSGNCVGLQFAPRGSSFFDLKKGEISIPKSLNCDSSSEAMALHNQLNSVGKEFATVKVRGANSYISHELGGMSAGLEDLDNDSRGDDDDSEGENLLPGAMDLVELDATEILAEHTHFCEICGKGFKRDANLRMHMRGHGDEYKTPAALARPDRGAQDTATTGIRRYSCPYVGCKRNKKHRKFQPLKTMLCVKNHYRRSHCPKILTCQKCMVKKFSVVADLKTHEKHCGRDKWQCSCGTTFSRKDKLLGHMGLFAGHTPVVPLNEMENASGGQVTISSVDPHESPTDGSLGSGSKSSLRFWD